MSRPSKVILDKLFTTKQDLGIVEMTEKDGQIYALGIGFNQDPLKKEDFKYTNEWDQQFTIFPTITASLRTSEAVNFVLRNPYIPEFPLHQLLHAEEKIYWIKPIRADTQYRQVVEMIDAVDKGKNAFFVQRIYTIATDAHGKQETIAYTDRTLFVRGLGGFGGKSTGKSNNIPDVPKREPDLILKETTYPGQAFFYRLTGDRNPLHIDPNFSAMGGFQKPIIHGMASYGVIARSLVQNLLNNDPHAMKSFQGKLIGHVFPGESFEIRVWKEGLKIYFLAQVVQRKTKVLIGVLTIKETSKL